MKRKKKHDGFKIFSRFLKEEGHGKEAVLLGASPERKTIDEESTSIWLFIYALRHLYSSELSSKWSQYIRENGYYDIRRHNADGSHRYVICKRRKL